MLRALYAEFDKKTYNLQPDNNETTIGRASKSHIQLNYKDISRNHARLVGGPDDICMIEDLGSTHGTWLNGKRLDPNRRVELKPGDSINLAGAEKYAFIYKAPLSGDNKQDSSDLKTVEQ